MSVMKSVPPAPAFGGWWLGLQAGAAGEGRRQRSALLFLVQGAARSLPQEMPKTRGVSSKEAALLLGCFRSAVLRENRYKWRKILTQSV